jgi:hypothetical protein
MNGLNVPPHGIPVLNDQLAIRPISPLWHSDKLLMPLNVLCHQPRELMVGDADHQ